ncbi:MAG TPA: cysteine hydrolase [Thermodesulfobacteriota bacterium]|nr:cysteine hydrolase [Thermodesulfobacteriota bacterium]
MEVKVLDRTRFIKGLKGLLEINPRTTALVAIDMHQGHLDPEVAFMLVPEEERKRVLIHTPRLIEIVRKYQIPIIHVIFHLRPIENKKGFNPFSEPASLVNEKLKPEERSWLGKPRVKGVWWRPKIMPEVAPGPNDYVIDNKKTYNIYLGTDLENLLRTLGVETVVLIGINTNTCDLNASFETVNRGFKLIVISDCVASSYGHDLHVFALQNISRCLGWVLTISEFEEKLKKRFRGRKGYRNII